MKTLTYEKAEQMFNDYTNGNRTSFYKQVDRLNKLQIVELISKFQTLGKPYHSTIAMLQNHFESEV